MTRSARSIVRPVAVLGVLAATVVLYHTTPDRGRFLRPITVSGRHGTPVHTPEFDIAVSGVRTGSVLAVPGLGDDHPRPLHGSPGWVVVTVEAESTRSTLTLSGVRIRARSGRTYLESRRGSIPDVDLTSQPLSPDLPVRVEVAAEMPRRDLAGASVEIARSPFEGLDAVARVPLPAPAADTDVVTMSRARALAPGPLS